MKQRGGDNVILTQPIQPQCKMFSYRSTLVKVWIVTGRWLPGLPPAGKSWAPGSGKLKLVEREKNEDTLLVTNVWGFHAVFVCLLRWNDTIIVVSHGGDEVIVDHWLTASPWQECSGEFPQSAVAADWPVSPSVTQSSSQLSEHSSLRLSVLVNVHLWWTVKILQILQPAFIYEGRPALKTKFIA